MLPGQSSVVFPNPTLIDIRDAVLTVLVIVIFIIVNVSALGKAYSLIGAVHTFPQIAGPIEKGTSIIAFVKAFTVILISAKGTVIFPCFFINFLTAFGTLYHHTTLIILFFKNQ